MGIVDEEHFITHIFVVLQSAFRKVDMTASTRITKHQIIHPIITITSVTVVITPLHLCQIQLKLFHPHLFITITTIAHITTTTNLLDDRQHTSTIIIITIIILIHISVSPFSSPQLDNQFIHNLSIITTSTSTTSIVVC